MYIRAGLGQVQERPEDVLGGFRLSLAKGADVTTWLLTVTFLAGLVWILWPKRPI